MYTYVGNLRILSVGQQIISGPPLGVPGGQEAECEPLQAEPAERSPPLLLHRLLQEEVRQGCEYSSTAYAYESKEKNENFLGWLLKIIFIRH